MGCPAVTTSCCVLAWPLKVYLSRCHPRRSATVKARGGGGASSEHLVGRPQHKAAAPSISQLTAGYGRPTRAGAREGRCACGDDGEHLQSTSALTLDRRRDLSELRFSA